METATKEKIKRRWRNHPQPTGKRVKLQPRDIWGVFRPGYEYPLLPRPFFEEFCRPYGLGEKGGMGMRFTSLYHEGGYLQRVAESAHMPDFARHAFYVVTERAEQALERKNYVLLPHSRITKFNPHLFMTSCGTASMELAVQDDPKLSWESRIQILVAAKKEALSIPCNILYRREPVRGFWRADDLFALGYENKSARVFFVEYDRNKEPANAKNHQRSSYELKIKRIEQVIGQGLYREYLGVKCGAVVLNVTTSTRHMQSLIDLTLELTGGVGLSYMLFKTVPYFGDDLDVPPVMRDLLTTPWKRAGFPDVDIRNPNRW